MAVGLGTVDMPVPAVAEWEWLNWRFPRAVHAGDTIYARWTLTQKRPPAVGASSSIVVWRVDVMNGEGAMCAEGEVGAKVRRTAGHKRTHTEAEAAPAEAAAITAPSVAAAPRRRRRRRNGNGTPPETPALAAPKAKQEPKPERAAGTSRRRRRRRSPSSAGASRDDDHEPHEAVTAEPPRMPVAATPSGSGTASGSTTPKSGRGLGGVLRRLRRT